MNPIAMAQSAGHTGKKILDFIKKLDPSLTQKINLALSAGYPLEKILGFIQQGGKAVSKVLPQTSTSKNLYEQASTNIHPALSAAAKTVGTVSALGTGAYALSRMGASTLGSILGTKSPAEAVANEAPGPAQAPSAFPPEAKVPEAISPEELKRRQALGEFKNPQKKQARKENLLTGLEQSFEKEYGKPTEVPKPALPAQIPPSETTSSSMTESIGNLALTPQGDLGEIESVKNGIARVKIGDTYKTRKETDLEASPLPQKELADLHDELILGIEKETGQQVSRNVNWAGYDPSINQLAYIPHGSDSLYVYDNIPEEDVKLLTGVLAKRKSSGDNFIGAWEQGSKSPIGAQMYQLIQKLQKERGGKGKEYSGKFKSVYSAYEPAVKASKKKKKEKEKREAEERKKLSGNAP